MVVVYGTKTEFRRDGIVGEYTCHNCGHTVPHSLCTQTSKFTLYYIPIIRKTGKRGIMCESCGFISPLSKNDYKARMSGLPQV